MDRYEFNQQLAAAAREIAEETSTELTLERVVQTATDLIEHCDLAGLAVFRPDGMDTAAANHDDLRLIDELQHKLGQGPCIDVLPHRDSLTVVDVSADPRWPTWGTHIAEHLQIRSAMSFRLFTDGETLAALNLYAKRPDAFDHDDLVDGLVVAAQAAVAMAATMELDQLHRAMRSRQVIGEAIGMLRERFNLTSHRAFDVLKRLSSQHNVKLSHIAQHVVDTGDLPHPAGSPDSTVDTAWARCSRSHPRTTLQGSASVLSSRPMRPRPVIGAHPPRR